MIGANILTDSFTFPLSIFLIWSLDFGLWSGFLKPDIRGYFFHGIQAQLQELLQWHVHLLTGSDLIPVCTLSELLFLEPLLNAL